jgi:predicted transcriptional regulator
MKTVILSLHKKWWDKIVTGEKTLEIRKSRPKVEGPFRVLVYVTGIGKIQGQFVCPKVMDIRNPEDIQVTKQSRISKEQITEYANGKKLAGWRVTDVISYYEPQKLIRYGLQKPPQSWCYYNGEEVPDFMSINQLANICGYFYNANFDPEAESCPNNGYNCRHPAQEEVSDKVGCCFQWSCPLPHVAPADEEDCMKYGYEDAEELEYVLVYWWRKGGEAGEDRTA